MAALLHVQRRLPVGVEGLAKNSHNAPENNFSMSDFPTKSYILLLFCLPAPSSGLGFLARQSHVLPPAGHPGVGNTTLEWHPQRLDHFNYAETRTFRQRVFLNADHWRPGAPILFYCGNEANVRTRHGPCWDALFSIVIAQRRSCGCGRWPLSVKCLQD